MRTSQAVFSAALALAGNAVAFWRMPCKFQTGIARIDPLVDPNEVSAHAHTITGGGGFGFNANYKTLTAEGSCTACAVTQDHSAYWAPTLNFVYNNGTAVMVPQVGGMLAYYLYYLDNVKAFPEGFRMLAGNKNVRNFTGPFPDTELSSWRTDASNEQFFLQQRAIGFNCLNYQAEAEPSLYRHVLPSKEDMDTRCTDGLRLELAFPSCGTGELDSKDHKSHVAYPSLVKEGNCPKGYDVHYPFIFFETIYATNTFAGESGEFVLSHGDPIGTGYHGDFIMGWESEAFLQQALDTCTNESGMIEDCKLFNIQSDDAAQKCAFNIPQELQNDDPIGPRIGLAVDVPIQSGPEEATIYLVAGQTSQAITKTQQSEVSSTLLHPALTYSATDPKLTSSTPLGQVVPQASTTTETCEVSRTVPSSTVTAVSSIESADRTDEGFISTTYLTSGNTIMEIFITEIDVTTTISVTETQPANLKRRRHLHRHLQDVHR